MNMLPIDEALADRNLLGAALGDISTWRIWVIVLKAAFGRPLTADELTAFQNIAGNRKPPEQKVRELWAVVARRGGKSRMAAAIATFIAGLVDHSGKLSAGEVGYVLVLAASKLQARIVHSYIKGFFEASPVLRQLVAEVTADEIRLTNGIVVAVHPNSFRTVRGRTLLACIFDETAFWRDENSAAPDLEVWRAVLPALATTGGMLVGISSPYRKLGLIYSKWREFFGKDDPNVLVIQSDSLTLNPTLDTVIIDAARAEDPVSARSEWDGEFRPDISTYADETAILACVQPGIFERPPLRRWSYTGFVDVAGGSGKDSMCLGIAHTEGEQPGTRILDVLRERFPPFSPEGVTEEFADLLKSYRVTKVFGDKYAGDWPAETFRKFGVNYQHIEKTKSQLYAEFLPMLNSRSVDLLDNKRLVSQLVGLERRTMRHGRDLIDSGPGGHDDVANVAAGALCLSPSAGFERRPWWDTPARKPYDPERPIGTDPLAAYR